MEDEIVALVESGCALIVGTVDATGMPEATRGWGALVLDGGARVRIALDADATTSLDNLRTTGAIAVTATDIRTLRSVQVKGRATGPVGPATADDRAREARFTAAVCDAIEEVDATPPELTIRLRPRDFVAVDVSVDELYDQTPGPSAGARLVVGA